MNKKILITGASGQLGYELQQTVPDDYELLLPSIKTLDICDVKQTTQYITKNHPDIIINAAAYTAVDKAEEEIELAWKVNQLGAENLAKISTINDIQLIHVSTDFIFDGKRSSPYLEELYEKEPINVYGKSKLAGEKAVLSFAPNNSLIIRTSWLYSSHGNNFVKSMLRLMQERDSLAIVADQVGTPTWARTLASAIWQLEESDTKGIYHCSDNGVASWYDFSVAIQTEALQQGLLINKIPIRAIRTQDYPTAATRPMYSIMDKTKIEKKIGMTLPHWQYSLSEMLKELKPKQVSL